MRVLRTLALLAIVIGAPIAIADCYTGGPNTACCTNITTQCKDASGAHWPCVSTTDNTCNVSTVIDAPPGVAGQIGYASGNTPVCQCKRTMRSCGPKANECITGSVVSISCFDTNRTGPGCSGI